MVDFFPRYELRTGKFGWYMFDIHQNSPLPLQEVVNKLNTLETVSQNATTALIEGIDVCQAEMEQRAAQQHAIWSHWMCYFLTKVKEDSDGYKGYRILQTDMDRWQKQMKTSYEDLTENEKEADQKEVDE